MHYNDQQFIEIVNIESNNSSHSSLETQSGLMGPSYLSAGEGRVLCCPHPGPEWREPGHIF